MADIYEHFAKGRLCSEVLMANMLDHLGMKEEALVTAMKGLNRGMGIYNACGIVTASACAFALTGEHFHAMFLEFYKWFLETYGKETEGIMCAALLNGDPDNAAQICPAMIAASWSKIEKILSNSR